jgi:hypothetical protein
MHYRCHNEVTAHVATAPETLFDYLDDHERLGAHMTKPSMMMMGGRMSYEFDAQKARAIGSVIRMGGAFLGLELFAEEVVAARQPPTLKIWETRGEPKLIIIGSYRMGFEIEEAGQGAEVCVFIDYNYSDSVVGRLLGFLLAPMYARWCVERMARDAWAQFSSPAPALESAH